MEQEKIDVARATPVTEPRDAAARPVRRGAPLWLQILLSLIVVVVAVAIAALFNSTANTLLADIGIRLPQLNATADATPSGAPASGQGQGQKQGQGQGGPGRTGGAGGARTAVVVTAPVTEATINNKLSAIGEGSAIHSVTVSFPSSGTLVSVDVKPGDVVQQGTKLAALDTGSEQIAYDKAMLGSEDADAALERAQTLAKTNSLSDTQLKAAQLAADQAKLAVNDAKLALDQRTITAPVAGTVGLIQASAGNQVTAQTVVTTIQDSSEILINFWVPERYSSQVSVGMPVDAESAALAGKTFKGTISAIDNKIDPDSRTLQVQATLPNQDGVIRAGMSFAVDMAFPGESFPAVDPLSIQWSNDGAYVWKLADSKVKKGMVEIIQRNTDGVLVKGDIKVGDAVVTQGVLQLSDGMTVRLLDAAPAATDGSGKPAAAAPQDGQAQAPAGDGKKKRQPSSEASSAAGG